MNDIRKVLSYNDVLLVPRYSGLEHIKDAKLDYTYNIDNLTGNPIKDLAGGKYTLNKVPLINAPMNSICTPQLLKKLHDDFNMPVSIHRWFDSAKEQYDYFESCDFSSKIFTGDVFLSVGALAKHKEWIDYLLAMYSEFGNFGILIDMANGDTKACYDTVKYIREKCSDILIMAGNIATKSGFKRLEEAGANFIRVGIGGGCFVKGTKILCKKIAKEDSVKEYKFYKKVDGKIVEVINKIVVKKGDETVLRKPIENIKIGDIVITHNGEWKEVENVISWEAIEDVVNVYKYGANNDNFNNIISCTKGHEFYVIHKDYRDKLKDHKIQQYAEWISAEKLTTDYLLLDNNAIKEIKGNQDYAMVNISKTEYVSYNGYVYDLTVKDNHSYWADGVIVHNSICSTRTQTGFGVPVFASILDCAQVKNKAYLVADGGIETPGDIVKAIGAGADMVMCGKMFAGTSLSNGTKYDKDFELTEDLSKVKYMSYHGLASLEAIKSLKTNKDKKIYSVEGVSGLVPYKGDTDDVVNGILGNLQCALSYYAGCKTWEYFQRGAKFIEISSSGLEENKTRVIQRGL